MKFKTLLAALILAAGPAFSNEVIGVWQTNPNDNGDVGHVEFYPCGATFCGRLIRSFHGNGQQFQSPSIGRNIVWDMRGDGRGNFRNGRIWDPGNDKTYSSKMVINGHRLFVYGCVGPICKRNVWRKVGQ